MSLQIYIGDDLLDVFPDTIVAQTLKANDFGDIQNRSLYYTNQFKVPFTPNNDRIYQNARDIRSQTSIPYTTQKARIIQNGIETESNGTHTLKKAETSYELYIISGASDFFKAIEGRKLTDLNLSALDGPWDPSTLGNTSDGVIFPYIYTGNFDLPATYYHTIIDQIFIDAGFDKAGSIFTNSKYLKLIIPFGRKAFTYDETFRTTYEFTAGATAKPYILAPDETVIEFSEPGKESDYYSTSISRFTNTSSVGIKASFFARVVLSYVGGVDGFIVISHSVEGNIGTVAIPSAGEYFTYSGYPGVWNVPPGEYVEVRVTGWFGGVGDFTVESGQFYNIISTIPVIDPAQGDTAFGKLLPDMLQSDLVKDFLIRFCLLQEDQNGVMHFKGVNEIITDAANSTDWTDKRDRVNDQVTYTPLDYAQENYFKYSNADDLTDELVGQGSMSINNSTLEASKDIYTSPFSNTSTLPAAAGLVLCAWIPIYDDALGDIEDFNNDPGIRLLLVRQNYSYEGTFNGSAFWKAAYFEDPQQGDSMGFQQLIDDHYNLLAESLQKAKLVSRKYNLTETDIQSMSFLVPVFDQDTYFLKNTIGPYVPGKPCEANLLVINADDSIPTESIAIEIEASDGAIAGTYAFDSTYVSGGASIDSRTVSLPPSSLVSNLHDLTNADINSRVRKTDNGGIAEGFVVINWEKVPDGIVDTITITAGNPVDETRVFTDYFGNTALRVSMTELSSYDIESEIILNSTASTITYDVTFDSSGPDSPKTQNLSATAAGTDSDAGTLYTVGVFPDSCTVGVEKTSNGGLADGEVTIDWLVDGVSFGSPEIIAPGDPVSTSRDLTGLTGIETLRVEISEAPVPLADYTIYGDLTENVLGIQTWDAVFGGDTLNLIGTGTIGPNPIASPSGSFSVAAAAQKTSNGGIALDGGTIDFIQNGVNVHSIGYAIGANVANRTYTFLGVAPGDDLQIIITEG